MITKEGTEPFVTREGMGHADAMCTMRLVGRNTKSPLLAQPYTPTRAALRGACFRLARTSFCPTTQCVSRHASATLRST